MRPWIWPGGKLHVRPCAPEDLRVGDIAVWFDGKRLLSHRVIELLADGRFVTRGDWYKRSDAPADANQLVGVAVRFSVRCLSYPLAPSQTCSERYSRSGLEPKTVISSKKSRSSGFWYCLRSSRADPPNDF